MTTPVVPDFILGLFQNEINKINTELLQKVCKIYEIDFEDVTKKLKDEFKVNLVLNKDERVKIVKTRPELQPCDRCIARLFKRSDLDLVQCTLRHYPDQSFCKRHQIMHDNGTLKYGTINDEETGKEVFKDRKTSKLASENQVSGKKKHIKRKNS